MIEVTLIETMGTDDRVVDAARVSLGRRAAQFGQNRNADLIAFCARSGHFSPFTHPQATFHIKAPLFSARQLFKSKIGFNGGDEFQDATDDALAEAVGDDPFSENEISRRYVDASPEFFKPDWRARAPGKKQGSAGLLNREAVPLADRHFHVAVVASLRAYEGLLSVGVAPEHARVVLPVAMETEFFWTGSLAAWARLARLRLAEDAQKETGEVARQVGEYLARLFPVSWPALLG